ncbi:hypothetical protein E4T56_gene14200 [Termitomyces sp. T112]|nr:hypothetical protein E4T56_gene14200 [Termitomyces sp. T112]
MKTGTLCPESPVETLPVILGDRTRHSRCPPEFLVEMSARDPRIFLSSMGKNLKIITGPEAVTFYKKSPGWRNIAGILAEIEGVVEGLALPCVVFAVAVEDAGGAICFFDNLLCLTFYTMQSARDAAEEKQVKYFHSQFHKTVRPLDGEIRRTSNDGVAETIIVKPVISEKKADEIQEP